MSWEDVHAAKHSVPVRASRQRLSIEPLVAGLIERFLSRFHHGTLTLTLPSGRTILCRGATPGVDGRLSLHRWRGLWRLVTRGDVGFGEAYMAGDWSTPDLPVLLECLLRNEQALAAAWQGFLTRLPSRLRHRARANTRRGSRRNIKAHYDLGNEFYAAWLDRGMNYSSALYASPSLSLEDAQIAKLDRAIALLEARSGESVLEIGCGWGALTERLAGVHGCRITGITLSREQRAYAEQRLCRAGVAERATIKLQDYRGVTGQFDRIVSIEMLEAAGEAYWPVYFGTLRARLAPGGTIVLQVITIEEARFAIYRRQPDFIQRHVFPGGMLPTIAIIKQQIEDAGLALHSLDLFGESYERTLAEWRRRYLHADPVPGIWAKHKDRFRRMWDYYLAYCEVGFRTGALNVGLYQICHK
jgi:cyclopropane-fatty-acyl-phospholipid synthase